MVNVFENEKVALGLIKIEFGFHSMYMK